MFGKSNQRLQIQMASSFFASSPTFFLESWSLPGFGDLTELSVFAVRIQCHLNVTSINFLSSPGDSAYPANLSSSILESASNQNKEANNASEKVNSQTCRSGTLEAAVLQLRLSKFKCPDRRAAKIIPCC